MEAYQVKIGFMLKLDDNKHHDGHNTRRELSHQSDNADNRPIPPAAVMRLYLFPS
jgi:hypothetical protein